MSFLGKKVKHKIFGTGTITIYDSSAVRVQFPDKEMDFSPDSFGKFLEFVDPSDQAQLLRMLQKKDEERIAAEARDPMRHMVTPQHPVSWMTGSGRRAHTLKRQVPPSNIAFKCNYCDGGKSKAHIGYLGACSDDVISYNIDVAGHSWCSAEDSYCMQYRNGEISRRELDRMCGGDAYVCYESQMLRNWVALAGYDLNGENKNAPRRIRQVAVNSLAVLTTREPYADEGSRFIFGVFLIDGVDQGDSSEEGAVWSDSKYRIELSPDEAHKMKFWNYHANDKKPEKTVWSQGLYRYLSDIEAVQILQDIVKLKQESHKKTIAGEFLEYYCKIHHIDLAAVPAANGALNR